jgi:DUF4097 and DUF4098 domain-containing protein YvlB
MKKLLILLSAISIAYGFDEEAKETIRKTFPSASRIDVEDVNGYIRVTGYNGSDIQLVAEKTIKAESAERLEAAKREVTLDMSQSGDTLTIYVDGPFRCHCEDNRNGIHERGHRGYQVTYNFELKVPTATFLRLSTVNGGDIRIENTTGDFDLSNVNDSIEMKEVAGSGQVHTVNGKITALFSKNPAGKSSFRTVNGTIETSFRPNLSADIWVKTFNGGAYTDFAATSLPRVPVEAERRNGKFVYRSDIMAAMRVGSGGPEYKYETLNGNVRIINRGQ